MRVPIGTAGREEFLAGVHAGVLSTVVGTPGRMLASRSGTATSPAAC